MSTNDEELLRQQVQLLAQSAAEVGAAIDDEQAFAAALSQMRQIGSQIDPKQMLDMPHLPSNAGVYADALSDMLAQIPSGWGRWISCGPGWYPLITSLHQQIKQRFPDYELQQCKEKYGSLRFYCEPGYPDINGVSYPSVEDYENYDGYKERETAYFAAAEAFEQSEEGERFFEDYHRRWQEQIEPLVAAAEKTSEKICEECGQPGQLMATRSRSPWYKTLCSEHSDRSHIPAEKWRQWWDDEGETLHNERMRKYELEQQQKGQRVAVICGKKERTPIYPDVEWLHNREQVDQFLASQPVNPLVFLAEDALAQYYLDRLAEPYTQEIEQLEHQREHAKVSGDIKSLNGRLQSIDLPERAKKALPRIYYYTDHRASTYKLEFHWLPLITRSCQDYYFLP